MAVHKQLQAQDLHSKCIFASFVKPLQFQSCWHRAPHMTIIRRMCNCNFKSACMANKIVARVLSALLSVSTYNIRHLYRVQLNCKVCLKTHCVPHIVGAAIHIHPSHISVFVFEFEFVFQSAYICSIYQYLYLDLYLYFNPHTFVT